MGCYNKIGFYSNLPIKENDEIVYFICGTLGKLEINSPSTFCEIEPIILPIFGYYSGYGIIDGIVANDNINSLTKTFGATINDIINAIETFAFINLNDIENDVVKLSCDEETKSYKLYCDILKKIVESKKWFFEDNKCKFSLCTTMEHLKVYKTMANMFQQHIVKEINEIDNLIKITTKYNFESFNLFNCAEIAFSVDSVSFNFDELVKQCYILSSYENIRDLSFHMIGYNPIPLNLNESVNEIKEFISFNNSLSWLCGKYSTSNYGRQSIAKNEFLRLNSCFKEIIDHFDDE